MSNTSLGFRVRRDVSANYNAVFIDGQTLRTPLDPNRPITELPFPEFYDVSFGTKCSGGCVEYCYASALKSGVHYTNLAEKIHKFFGAMPLEKRPFQMACGGQAESMENPECWEALEAFRSLGIIPNLTTNGMFVNEAAIEKIHKYCGGIAVTLHPHLEKCWRRAITMLHEARLKINVHVIISDAMSVENFQRMYEEYHDMVEYFVLLPYMNVGHASKHPKKVDLASFGVVIDRIYTESKVAFGANFYPWLKQNGGKYGLALYQPETFSKYLLLNDRLEVFNNSFEMKPVPYSAESGCELGHARMEFCDL